MSFDKFVSLIKNGLYFCRLDLFNDPFEGSFAYGNQKIREGVDPDSTSFEKFKHFSREVRKLIFVNCWHMNDYENYAMWKIYSYQNKSISIRTSIKRLKESIEDRSVIISEVKYIDYRKEMIPEDNMLYIFLYKRNFFKFENELRLWFQDNPDSVSNGIVEISKKNEFVKINLETLIEEIYISPNADISFYNKVKKELDKINLNKPIIQSSLDDKPLY